MARLLLVTYELERRAGWAQSSITWQVSARGKTEKFPCFMVCWCCMLVVGCKCLQSRGLRLGSCKIGWLASGGCWVGGSKRRQGHDDQRLTASLLVASKVVGSGGSWIVGQRSVVLGMDEGNLAKNPWIKVTLGEESGGGGALRTETRFKRQGQGSPPLGEIETEPNKESLPANPIFNFQEFG